MTGIPKKLVGGGVGLESAVFRRGGLFSDGVGLPDPGVLMKSIEATFLRPDALPGVNHMRGMQYQIVLNKIIWSELS